MFTHCSTDIGELSGLSGTPGEESPGAIGWSMRIVVLASGILAAQVLLLCTVLIVPQDFLKAYSHLFYLTHYCLFLPFFFTSRDRCAFLFSPSFMVVSYVCMSFVIGGYAFSRGYVLHRKDFADFQQWDYFNLAVFYIMLCNVFAMIAYFLTQKKRVRRKSHHVRHSLRYYKSHVVAASVVLSLSVLVSLTHLSFCGRGDMSVAARTFGLLVIAISLARARWQYRAFVYVAFLFLLAAAEYGNRRYVITFMVSLLMIEAAYLQDLRLSLRCLLLCVLVVGVAAFFQITMTIARGVAGFQGSYWQTFAKINTFVGLSNVTTFSLAQTEGPSAFFHGHNAIEYVWRDKLLLTCGITLVKPLFIPVPRSVWPGKPESFVQMYTTRWDPAFRQRGGSAGACVYAEYFWNFHLLGAILVLFIFSLLNSIFFSYIERLRDGRVWPFIYLGVAYGWLFMYARGQGLDTLSLQIIFAFGVQKLVFSPFMYVRPMARPASCSFTPRQDNQSTA